MSSVYSGYQKSASFAHTVAIVLCCPFLASIHNERGIKVSDPTKSTFSPREVQPWPPAGTNRVANGDVISLSRAAVASTAPGRRE
ncbi:hypothetical protein RRG08_038062 [Elysia crispata]|uniref:Uncharacterized protein n=1 Tax=Elysia crispata TaxID=231223 RepID=A0AAE0ZYV3_9GAST|nr:hypothetical protein RRG08_038062 [Elysia crispata]